MSDRLSLGNYSLEITDREVVVRDQRGTVLETVSLDSLSGNLTLPDGHQVDLAALLADAVRGLTDLDTAAGPAGTGNFGPAGTNTPGSFRAFSNSPDMFIARQGAGTLGNTSLQYGTVDGDPKPADEKETLLADGTSAVPFTWSSHDQWQVAENQSGGAFGRLVDGDPQDFTFQVSDPRFEIVDGILQLKAGESFDYESEPFVDLVVTATSRTGETQSQPLRIEIVDRNEAQTDLGLDNMTVQENAPGAVIGNLTVVDPDAGDSQTFVVSDSRFEVVDGQLKLKDGIALDFESEPVVNVTVTATDRGGHSIAEQFTIGVGDVNEAQTALSLDGANVPENAAGAVIGNLTVVDPDAGDSQTFAVSDNRFEVVNGQLKLKDGIALDFESEPLVNVTVTATDQSGHSIAQQFAINVGDVNEAQTALSLDGANVPENAAGAVIGNLTVVDPDAGDSQTFAVSDNRFEVVNGQLKLKDGIALDFESEPVVNVTVTATDQGGHSIAQQFAINVGDVNEAQTALSLDGAHVAENAAGAVIGNLTVVDPDAGDSQTFAVSDNRFEVVDGQLKLKDGIALDFESEPLVNVTVTATDQGGHSIAEQFTIGVGDVNEAQTAMSIDHHQVAENAAGAVVGTLSVADPDAGDSQTFTVSDSRFEVVNSQLQLKSGVSLDHEAEPSVNVTVTATDKAGHQISQIVTIDVTDVNEAPTAILLSNATVAENASGATVGKLSTVDPDAGDTFSYQVSDNRFQVVNGQLQLKSGIAFDYETEPSVNLKVTSTDSAGHSIQQSFTVNITNVNEAPVVTVKDGSVETHIVNTSTTYNPSADATVGAYLYSNDSAGVKVPSASLLNGVAASNMTLTAPTTVSVTFQKEAAGNHNMVGTYQYDDKGNIIPGSVKFVWLDASATTEGKLGSTMVKDFLGYAQSNTVSLGAMAAGTHVGFFTISNGAADSTNTKLLGNAAAGAANQAAAMDAIASQLSIKVDANGNGHVYVGNSQMNGDVFFSHDKTLNTDFSGGKDIDHMASGVNASLGGQLLIGVEDLNGGGDRDYNDVVFSVNLGTYNVVKTTQSVVQPSVDFSDIDSHALSQAVIHSSGFQAGDALNVPASGLFNVNVAHSGSDVTITITGKTGGETVDQYESFVNSITFSTSSKTEGDRNIDYSIVDEGGLTSNIGHAHIGIANSYEISSSQLAANQNALGSGDDHLYLNSNLSGHLDFGSGHDTLHFARNNDSLGHSDFAKLDNVEAIDMTGFGGNKVALSIVDVLDMTDADHRLTVVGDKGDVVTLSGDGSGHHWSVVDTGDQFTTYAWSDPVHQAVVEISNQLTAQLG